MTSFQNTISTYRPRGTAPQRTVGLIFAVALNAVIVYALLAGLGMVPMPVIPPPFNGSVIIETHDIDLPPPPQPVIPQPQINPIVPPIIEIPLEPEGARKTITPDVLPVAPPASEPEQQSSIERPIPPPVIVTPARAIMSTHTIPDYPPVSRRLAEQGTLRLRLAIGVNGVVEDAQVEASSGYKRLDEAAVQWVKAHWRYEPAMQGARPVASTATAQVIFALK